MAQQPCAPTYPKSQATWQARTK